MTAQPFGASRERRHRRRRRGRSRSGEASSRSVATPSRIFEGRDEVGGQVVTFLVGGEPLECFYHHIFTNDTTVIRYIDDLGLGDKLRWIEPRNAHFVKGRPWPFVTPIDLLKFRAIPFTSRVRLGLAAVWLGAKRMASSATKASPPAQWMERAVGKKAFAAFWGPLLKGKFADQADNVGMVWLWNKIYLRFASRKGAGAKESLGYLEGSFKGLLPGARRPRRPARGVTIHLETPVEDIAIEDGRVTGIQRRRRIPPVRPGADDDARTSSPSASRRTCPPPTSKSSTASATSGRPASCWHSTAHSSDFYWLTIGDDLPFVACVEHTNFMPPERYGGNHVVYLSNYVAPDHPVLQMDADQVLESYLPGLRAINPELRPLVGAGEVALQGPRRPARHHHPLLRINPRHAHRHNRPLPFEHDPGLPRGPRPELQPPAR